MSEGIQDIQDAQKAMAKYIASLKMDSAFGRALYIAAMGAQRYLVSITHVWRYKGGALRASHRISIDEARRRAIISIDERAINPRGQRPAIYGPVEHARGGSHAFYARTEQEYGREIAHTGARLYLGELP